MGKTCNGCGNSNETLTQVTMSSADWQKNEKRHERKENRLLAIILVLILLLVGSNCAWIYYESQFETVETAEETIIDAEQGDGINIVGGGDVDYGTESKNNKKNNN